MKKNIIPVVGGLIRASDGEILLVSTHKWKGLSIPGGKIEYKETISDALRREIWEETNLTISHYCEGPLLEEIEGPEFCRKEHFIMFNFICFLSPNSAKTSVRLNEELTDYIWVDPKEALTLSLNPATRDLVLWYNKRFGSFGRIGMERQPMPARIGVFPEEKSTLQTIEVTLHAAYDMSRAVQTDSIVDAIDYTALLDTCKTIAVSKHFDLLETLAQSMIDTIFATYPVEEIELSIYKIGAILGKNSSVSLHKIRKEVVCLGS